MQERSACAAAGHKSTMNVPLNESRVIRRSRWSGGGEEDDAEEKGKVTWLRLNVWTACVCITVKPLKWRRLDGPWSVSTVLEIYSYLADATLHEFDSLTL